MDTAFGVNAEKDGKDTKQQGQEQGYNNTGYDNGSGQEYGQQNGGLENGQTKILIDDEDENMNGYAQNGYAGYGSNPAGDQMAM